MASNALLSSMTTIYSVTRTTTISTRLTAASHQNLITIPYPWPAITHPPEYTTRPPPPNAASRDFPEVLPVLVLTQMVGIVLNQGGRTISVGTRVQLPPHLASLRTNVTYQEDGVIELWGPECSDWGCWPKSEKTVTIVVVCILGLLILLLLYLVSYSRWGRAPRVRIQRPLSLDGRRDLESKTRPRRRGPIVSYFFGLPRRTERDRRRQSEPTSSLNRPGIALGPQRPPPPLRANLQPHPAVRGPVSGNRLRVHPGEGARPVDISSMKPDPGNWQPSWYSPSSSIVEVGPDYGVGPYWHPQSDQHNRPPSPLIPQGVSVRDFAYQRTGGDVRSKRAPRRRERVPRNEQRMPRDTLGISVAVAAEGSKTRGSTPLSRRRSAVGKDRRPQESPVTPTNPRNGQTSSKDARRRARDDAELDGGARRRNSGREGERLRARSFSPPREQRSKHKRNHSETPSKLWALLPLALEAIHEFSKPRGGWRQYHKGNERTKENDTKRERSHRHRRKSAHQARKPPRRYSIERTNKGPQISRAVSASGERRRAVPPVSPLGGGSRGPPPAHQPPPPQRRRSTRHEARIKHQKHHSTGLDGSNSTDDEEEWSEILNLGLNEELPAEERTMRGFYNRDGASQSPLTEADGHVSSVHAHFKDTVLLTAQDTSEVQHLPLNDISSRPAQD